MGEQLNLFKVLNDLPFDSIEIIYSIPPKISLDSLPKFNEQQSRMFKIRSSSQGKNHLLILRFNNKKLQQTTEEELDKTIKELSDIIKDKVESRIIISRHLPIDKYSPNPPLPLSIFEKDEILGDAVMTGVKFSFHKTKEDLKFAVIDVSPCLGCGEVDIGINLTLLKEMTVSVDDLIDILKKSEEYFKYFYKTKDA